MNHRSRRNRPSYPDGLRPPPPRRIQRLRSPQPTPDRHACRRVSDFLTTFITKFRHLQCLRPYLKWALHLVRIELCDLLSPGSLKRSSMDTILPSATSGRWVVRRKATIVTAVHSGALSLEEACHRYMLTADEFVSWEKSFDQHGLAGLQITRLQHYRQQQTGKSSARAKTRRG